MESFNLQDPVVGIVPEIYLDSAIDLDRIEKMTEKVLECTAQYVPISELDITQNDVGSRIPLTETRIVTNDDGGDVFNGVEGINMESVSDGQERISNTTTDDSRIHSEKLELNAIQEHVGIDIDADTTQYNSDSLDNYEKFREKGSESNDPDSTNDIDPDSTQDSADFLSNFLKFNKTRSDEENSLYKCKHCGGLFKKLEYFEIHTRAHAQNSPFKCEICYKHFRGNNKLVRHVISHTDEKPFSCKLCEKKFTLSYSLKAHFRDYHKVDSANFKSDNNKNQLGNNSASEDNDTSDSKKLFQCDTCDKKFSRRYHLIRHLKIHSKNMHVEKSFSVRETLFSCICGKSFIHPNHLSKHQKIHEMEKFIYEKSDIVQKTSFVCNICENDFSHPDDLTRHQKTHDTEKLFNCHLCDKKFIQQDMLYRHYDLMHKIRDIKYSSDSSSVASDTHAQSDKDENSKNISKDTGKNNDTQNSVTSGCSMRLRSTKNSNISETDSEYKCKFCKKSFVEKNKRDKHLENIHFHCNKCRTIFATGYRLNKHKQRICYKNQLSESNNAGKKVECTKMDFNKKLQLMHKITNNDTQLKVNSKIESDTNRKMQYSKNGDLYQCEMCYKKFKLKTVLNWHMKSHNSETYESKHETPPATEKSYTGRNVESAEVSTSFKIDKHFLTHVTNAKKINTQTCKLCNLTFNHKQIDVTDPILRGGCGSINCVIIGNIS